MPLYRTILPILVLCFGIINASVLSARPFEAQYQVGNGWVTAGTLTLRLQQLDASSWLFEGITTPQGLFSLAGPEARIHERIVLQRGDDGLWQTLRFERREGEQMTHQWEQLGPPDGLSALLNMAAHLRQQQRQGKLLHRNVSGETRTMHWAWLSTDPLTLGNFGTLATEHIHRANQVSDTKSGQHSWHAAEFDYLPVKMEDWDKGKMQLRIQLKSWRWL